MPKLNQACAIGCQNYNTSACSNITLPAHFSCKISQREPTIFNKYKKHYKSVLLQVILWFDVPISVTILDIKSVKILQNTFKLPTLFSINSRRNECRSTFVMWSKGSMCSVKNMLFGCLFFFSNFCQLMFWTLIITTKSWRLQSVDLENSQGKRSTWSDLIGSPFKLKTVQ